MTDQFEKWLEEEIKKSGDMLEITKDKFDDGMEQGYSNALAYYREFLKEQKSILFAQSQHGISLQLEAIAEVLTIRTLVDEAGTLRVVAARLK